MRHIVVVIVALAVALGVHAVGRADGPAAAPAARAPRWEYKVLDPNGREDLYVTEPGLNELGQKGWELVLIERAGRLWFKRPAP